MNANEKFIAADAHVAGMISGKAGIVHLHMGDGPRGLDLVRRALEHSEIPPRVFHPTHINRNKRLFAEATDFIRRGGYLDITAFPPEEDPGDSLSAAESLRPAWLTWDEPARAATMRWTSRFRCCACN